jgi:hypothetical protein
MRIIKLFLILAFLQLLFPRNAHAYLDPATGSYVLQIIIAAVVGGLFLIKQYFAKIRTFFKNVFSKEEEVK